MMRPADFAGSWYPKTSKLCKVQIEDFIKAKKPCDTKDVLRIGGLVPHAGWPYSGKIACNIITCLKSKKEPDTIVIFGKHTTPYRNNSIMKKGSWETPLGELEIDSEFAEKLEGEFHFELESAHYYEPDNTIELQLPFIKYHFPKTKILPIGVPKPDKKTLEIGTRVAKLAKELKRDIKIIGSTDMTHYGPNYGFTQKGIGQEAVDWVVKVNDKKMIDLFLAMNPDAILDVANSDHNCCCSAAAATAVTAIKALGAKKGHLIDYYTSYDIQPNSSFVGYAGVLY